MPAAAKPSRSPRVLLVTNDFPPRAGGIQNYLADYLRQLPELDVTVYAPQWKGAAAYDAAQPFEVVRHRTSLMLPTPAVASRARKLVKDKNIDTVWFGAAAPLATLAPLLGAERSVASTHGHEVGWSMLPPARAALRQIGEHTDVITYVSKYTRNRFSSAFGPNAALEHLPSGIDTERFRPDSGAREELRRRYGLGDAPVILCLSRLVPRKGQDQLLRALPAIRAAVPGTRLVIVGGGPYGDALHALARQLDLGDAVLFTGGIPAEELAAHHNLADVFAMPCRTRGAGLDVEGLGIVFLEASASGIPVVAGSSGGAPETVWDGETGYVVDGNNVDGIAARITLLLSNRDRAAAMGAAGRVRVGQAYNWDRLGRRLLRFLGP